MIRVGFGFDTHQLAAGQDFWLGGVKVAHEKGSVGHSDADVLLHAITDALLGAAALGDIGQHFPDTDAAYLGADSQVLLKLVGELLQREGFVVVNIDSTIHAQTPKLAPHILGMRDNISSCLGLELSQVNVKAKTAEKMGPVGLQQSMEARAVVLLYKV